jgi:hypothetical protein
MLSLRKKLKLGSSKVERSVRLLHLHYHIQFCRIISSRIKDNQFCRIISSRIKGFGHLDCTWSGSPAAHMVKLIYSSRKKNWFILDSFGLLLALSDCTGTLQREDKTTIDEPAVLGPWLEQRNSRSIFRTWYSWLQTRVRQQRFTPFQRVCRIRYLIFYSVIFFFETMKL